MSHVLLDDLRRIGVIATVRAPSASAAVDASRAMIDGGVTAIEITYTTPDAAEAIAELSREHGDAIALGAGTLVEPSQVAEAVEAGAAFLVAPGFDDEVVAAMRSSDAMTMVGAYTPTEVMRVAKAGVHVVKFFPGSLGGPGALKAIRGPFPTLDYIPTGGVNAQNVGDWLAAGAVAVGAGSELLPAAAVASGDRDTLTAKAREFVAALRAARG